MISLGTFETMEKTVPVETVEEAIHLVRGQKVMLDSDLAKIYGVTTMRLNEQLKRNRKRFSNDFAFQLKRQEFTNLISQNAISSSHGGRRKLPWAFTEHGALMLASVLNSGIAIEASVRIVRAFVRLREMVSAHQELTAKFKELEGHDDALANLFSAIRQLLDPQPPKEKREIGFHVRENSPRYRLFKKKT